MATANSSVTETARAGGASAKLPVMLQMKRFWPRHRRALWQASAASGRFQDLLRSFPAASVEIVSLHPEDPVRRAAKRCVEEGRSRAEIAATLNLPVWTSKLAPEAIMEPLSGRLVPGAYDTRLGSRLLNLAPKIVRSARNPFAQGNWLLTALAARAAYDDEFALWIAGQHLAFARNGVRIPVQPLALYCWYSRHPEHAVAAFIDGRWSAKMGLATGAGECWRFLHAVLEAKCLGSRGTDFSKGYFNEIDGYTFVPLLMPDKIIEEGCSMRHCVAQYVSQAVSGLCLLWSIRKNGVRVATMEIKPVMRNGAPAINQLKGARNLTPPGEVLEAAQCWLGRNSTELTAYFQRPIGRHCNAAFSRSVWRPYAAAIASDPGIGIVPAKPSVDRVLVQMRDLWSLEK